MTPEQIAEARARCDAALTGPWVGLFSSISDQHGKQVCHIFSRDYSLKEWTAIREFIAHARTDLPAALDALEAERKRVAELEAENARLRAALEKLRALAGAIENEVVVSGTAADCVRQYVNAALEGGKG